MDILQNKTAQDIVALQIKVLRKLTDGSMTFEQLDWFQELTSEERDNAMGKNPKKKFDIFVNQD